ncbi:Outer membrane protein assembly factor YaeT precursor [Chitinispirillum alkaliphilum]|nr:Outer membrane protein assembly factor YaeT precursor [Chitinispirillum alkaliphilum]
MDEVIFTGNQNISSGELLETMTLQPRGIFRKVTFSIPRLSRDISSIEAYYRHRGFLDANVEDFSIVRDSLTMMVTVVLFIDEGKLTTIDSVIFRGNKVFNDSFYRTALPLRAGDPLDSTLVEQSALTIADSLTQRAHLFTNVTYSMVPPEGKQNRGARVIFSIREGPLVRAGEFQFTGLQSVRETVVQRELLFSQGDLLTAGKITQSVERLYNTGLFRFVNIIPVESPASPGDTLDAGVILALSERDMFDIQLGGGYGTYTGWYAQLELIYRNLFGLGHRVGTGGIWAEVERGVELSYLYPRVFNSPLSLDTRSFWETREQAGVEGNFYGGRTAAVFPFRDFTMRGWFEAEFPAWIREPPPTPLYPPTPLDNTYLLGWSISRDTRQNIISPELSSVVRADLEIAGLIPAGYRFYRIRFDLRNFFPLTERLTFSWGVQSALGSAWGDYESSLFPPQERFRLGQRGIWAVRGYEEEDLMPVDELGNVRGGEVSVVANVFELRFSFLRNIQGALFMDAGRVWRDFDDLFSPGLQFSAGPGLILFLPFALARLDYGVPLFPLSSGRFHFSLGPAF